MKALILRMAARLGIWVPCCKVMPDKIGFGRVLVNVRFLTESGEIRNETKIAEHLGREWIFEEVGLKEWYREQAILITHWRRLPLKGRA